MRLCRSRPARKNPEGARLWGLAARLNARKGQVIRVDGVGIDHRLAAHLIGDDLAVVDQVVGLGSAESASLQRLLQRNQISLLRTLVQHRCGSSPGLASYLSGDRKSGCGRPDFALPLEHPSRLKA